MRVNSTTDARLNGGVKTFASHARRIEKTSASSGLGTQQQEDPHKPSKSAPRLQVELVCQDETERFDPFRDAPRLVPAFVAQVLGQAMPERRENVTVETAYGKCAPRQALLLDRKS
jgi:hypothetical protein